MATDGYGPNSLLLVPLTDEVHFPRTELQLRVVEPEYREILEDLFMLGGPGELLGTVLLKPEWAQVESGDAVYGSGTAARLLGLEHHSSGCDILLRGEYRFEVEREIGCGPGRRAVVRPVLEPDLCETDPGIQVVRGELVECVSCLAQEIGERFALDGDQLSDLLDDDRTFEETVNMVAANLDITPLRKLRLLSDGLPDRALNLLAILRSRRQVLGLLRPYRHLAQGNELN